MTFCGIIVGLAGVPPTEHAVFRLVVLVHWEVSQRGDQKCRMEEGGRMSSMRSVLW